MRVIKLDDVYLTGFYDGGVETTIHQREAGRFSLPSDAAAALYLARTMQRNDRERSDRIRIVRLRRSR